MDVLKYIAYCFILPFAEVNGYDHQINDNWYDYIVCVVLYAIVFAILYLIAILIKRYMKRKKKKRQIKANQKNFMDSTNERETINKIEIDETSDKKE